MTEVAEARPARSGPAVEPDIGTARQRARDTAPADAIFGRGQPTRAVGASPPDEAAPPARGHPPVVKLSPSMTPAALAQGAPPIAVSTVLTRVAANNGGAAAGRVAIARSTVNVNADTGAKTSVAPAVAAPAKTVAATSLRSNAGAGAPVSAHPAGGAAKPAGGAAAPADDLAAWKAAVSGATTKIPPAKLDTVTGSPAQLGAQADATRNKHAAEHTDPLVQARSKLPAEPKPVPPEKQINTAEA